MSHPKAVGKLSSKNLKERTVSGLVTRVLGVMDTLERALSVVPTWVGFKT